MKIRNYLLYTLALLAILMLQTYNSDAQRLQRGAASRAHKPNVSRPSSAPKRTINGGSQKMPDRKVSSPANARQPVRSGNTSNTANVGNRVSQENKNNIGNRVNAGNKVNIDNSKKNVNINIDNSKDINVINNRNTVVRRNPVPYRRPPYRYGGFSFYAYRPYYYHPYRPFYWGPVWHPWGFFVATLAATAIIISVENQQYHYDQGVYYIESDGGYTVVQAPVGATIKVLPENSQTVVVNETTNNYYYGGTYYEKSSDGYTVVPPTSGTIVENLPEGGEEVKIGDVTYVQYGETYYQPVQVDGKDMYEVVDVQEGDS